MHVKGYVCVSSCKYVPGMCYVGKRSSKASIRKLPKLLNSSSFLEKHSCATYNVIKCACSSEICLCHLCPLEMRRTAFVEWV